MWWKYVAEVVLAVASLALGLNCWSIWKSPRFFRMLVRDPKSIGELVAHFGHDRLRQQGGDIKPVFGSYYKNILAFQSIGWGALRKAANLLLVLTAAVFAGSYVVGSGYAVTNITLFCLVGLLPISNAAKNNMVNDYTTVLLNVYKWNLENPAECLTVISRDAPWLSATLFAVKRLE
jgi:hypothetical protein